ncbi:Putative NmrA-like domain, NAD(P)-binding domain superfamily [Colletotrichum destructivum]|uniref:NmrA-like domain, NAD(P)-binding domain superfamily n=1 Tax=Colletotrichum destructivum TaxID=34406 RepID=A0AAX4I8N1_9PEZI|nr:Putative NmrA-like domain, NAD(P)-binding domain superfamily [Colletotrichum destructivum]
MRVTVIGATGETGSAVVDGLLNSPEVTFDVTALIRPASMSKPSVLRLQDRGVHTTPFDIDKPIEELAAQLQGVDVLISCLLMNETLLADAAKKAGVKRFVPCWWATVMPRGFLSLRDGKEALLDHIRRLHLPYTAIDVGWWYQISLPRLPSGRLDRNLLLYSAYIPGDGSVPSGRTDRRDIGKYVARIIADPRTLNRKVFAYTDLRTHNEVYDTVEQLSGEQIPRIHRTAEEVEAEIAKSKDDPERFLDHYHYSYHMSCDIKGENTPEYARYLGYLVAKDLYPDLHGISFEDFVKETLEKGLEPMYEMNRDVMLKYGTLAFRGANLKDSA